MSTMRQYYLPQTSSFSDLTMRTVPIPKPSAKEVLVKVRAVSLNFRDLIVAKGKYFGLMKDDLIPCSDGAGEVVEVGADVTQWRSGDRVAGVFNLEHQGGKLQAYMGTSAMGGGHDGMLSEYVVLPENGLVRIPANLSFEEGATLPCAAVTAWSALYGVEPLLPGQTVLLEGTGGVSIFGLQLAKAAGAKTIVTSSSDAKLEVAKKLGATHAINYKTEPDWELKVKELTDGKGVHHVLDVGGPNTLTKVFNSLASGGWIHAIGSLGGQPRGAQANITMLCLQTGGHLRGVLVGSRRQFEDMNALVESANVHPCIDKVFEFEHAKQAYEHVWSQKHVGKVVIRVNGPHNGESQKHTLTSKL